MSKSLDEVKENISQKYLGKFGIHAIAVHRKTNSLNIYIDAEPDESKKNVLEEIEKEIAPFSLITIKEERAGIN